MKRTPPQLALVVAGMVAVGIGCQSEPPAVPQAQQPAANSQFESTPAAANVSAAAPIDSPAEAMTFVSLKVPNMV